jgi:hypothetical protein
VDWKMAQSAAPCSAVPFTRWAKISSPTINSFNMYFLKGQVTTEQTLEIVSSLFPPLPIQPEHCVAVWKADLVYQNNLYHWLSHLLITKFSLDLNPGEGAIPYL